MSCYEDSEILTTPRGKTYVLRNDKKVYVFQDPVTLSYYNVIQGIELDKQRYHKKTLCDYFSTKEFENLLIPHSRRQLTKSEARMISSKLYKKFSHYFEPEETSNFDQSQVEDRPYREARNRRIVPREFTVDIPENVLESMRIVSEWYMQIVEDIS
ncbi:hypothetical protein MT325_M817R [Paramecium bursaria chlorella virus MT325]|uniref:Uncharacterized protein M817R n=1 Tax=Paramecium bursaria Chlorella virus MT325 TaxID=346932 RepID=A7IVJ7_PBCVM|nr:hypothetical protein MT325_M817R [Paramecium bursaria chlorella virus MT325]AGE49000.1 hypothetical protein PBCVAP110A_974R [Paramecium bursaria Chlorella virus AP110A]